nr:MAG TPA: hypothetical protein [Caudoviricetes sp.]
MYHVFAILTHPVSSFTFARKRTEPDETIF